MTTAILPVTHSTPGTH